MMSVPASIPVVMMMKVVRITTTLAILTLCSSGSAAAFTMLVKSQITKTTASSSSSLTVSTSKTRMPLSKSFSGSDRQDDRSGNYNNNPYDSLPSQEEIAKQKSEAYNALSLFHETKTYLPMMSSTSTSPSQEMIQSLLRDLDDDLNDDQTQDIQRPEYWFCQNGAITYAVPIDPAAGLKRGAISEPYSCGVRLEMDMDLDQSGGIRKRKRGLRLIESIQFHSGGGEAPENEGIPFLRSIPLSENFDVDAVDGSYSLDIALSTTDDQFSTPVLPLLPPSLLGSDNGRGACDDPMAVKFLVEHTLAVSETERCRCFLVYGDAHVDDRRIGISEGKVSSDEDNDDDDFAIVAARLARSDKNAVPVKEIIENNYRLLSVILADETKVHASTDNTMKGETKKTASQIISQVIESSAPSESLSASSNLFELNELRDGKLNQIIQSLQNRKDNVVNTGAASTTSDNIKMERVPMGMFGLTSGVWLGDTFIRENMPLSLQRARESRTDKNRGFGLKKKQRDSDTKLDEDRFATWSMGVQKVALRFELDFSNGVSQSYTYGKVMGTATSLSSMANIKSDGMMVINASRPSIKREERRIIWDMDGGLYIAGVLGSCYFRAPRYMSFSQTRSYVADAYLTEFMVFYQTISNSSNNLMIIGEDGTDDPKHYCSRSCRLYNSKTGSLQQGSTAFFTLQRLGSEQNLP